jgi:hypothetical protein
MALQQVARRDLKELRKEHQGAMAEISDGLEALRKVMSLREIASLIERTARWVSPETFKLLPLWFPEHGRRSPFYKGNWSEPQMNKNRTTGHSVHKSEGNVHANKALTLALGLRSKHRPNWSCCHIWGIDDARYQLSNAIVMDRRFFSCVGNMVLLPTPLKAFTDTMPDVKAKLRICARNLYGWPSGQQEFLATSGTLAKWTDWDSYPESWPRTPHEKLPLGVVPLSPAIRDCAKKRLGTIRKDLEHAGPHYPREEVKAALAHWKIEI